MTYFALLPVADSNNAQKSALLNILQQYLFYRPAEGWHGSNGPKPTDNMIYGRRSCRPRATRAVVSGTWQLTTDLIFRLRFPALSRWISILSSNSNNGRSNSSYLYAEKTTLHRHHFHKLLQSHSLLQCLFLFLFLLLLLLPLAD